MAGRGPIAGMARRAQPDDAGAGAAGQRRLRVGEELRHVLAQLLRPGRMRDPALADASITVTEVRVSPDLRNATVFVMPLGGGNADEVVAGLERGAAFLRGQVARAVTLRRVPNLKFALDRAFDSADRIAGILARPAVARDLGPRPDDDDAG